MSGDIFSFFLNSNFYGFESKINYLKNKYSRLCNIILFPIYLANQSLSDLKNDFFNNLLIWRGVRKVQNKYTLASKDDWKFLCLPGDEVLSLNLKKTKKDLDKTKYNDKQDKKP